MRSLRSVLSLLVLMVFALVPSYSIAQSVWVPDTAGISAAAGTVATAKDGTVALGSLTIAQNGTIFVEALSPRFHSPEGICRSTDNGDTWVMLPKGQSEAMMGPILGIDYNKELNYPNGDIYVKGQYEYYSTDEGMTWTQIRDYSDGDYVVEGFAILPGSVAQTAGIIFIATGSTGLQVTVDRGNSFYEQPVFTDEKAPTYVYTAASHSIFAANDHETDRGSGDGSNWFALSNPLALGTGICFASNAGTIVAGGSNGIWMSTDDGSNWVSIGSASTNGYSESYCWNGIAIDASGTIYAAPATGGISQYSGGNWTDISSGIPGDTVNALAIAPNGTLYVTTNYGVFYNSATGAVSENPASTSFTLDQNSPNPVTTSSSIHFSVPEAGTVSLRVFNAAGEEMESLANGFYAPGSYTSMLDARSLTNGVYYYRLEQGDQSQTRMLVVAH